MTDVVITAKDIVVEVEQPTTPSGAQPPPKVGLVEINQIVQRGSIWFTGSGAPVNPGGQFGDLYLDVDTGDIYRWDGDSWEYQRTFAPSTLTAEEILAMLITVDGVGSMLDADFLDGHNSDYFATQAGLDANTAHDTVQDGLIAQNAADILQNASDISDNVGQVADLQADKVEKAGDTMTGPLTVPQGTATGSFSSPYYTVGTTDNSSAGTGIVLMKRTSGTSEAIYFSNGAGGYRGTIYMNSGAGIVFRVGDNVTDDITFNTSGQITTTGSFYSAPAAGNSELTLQSAQGATSNIWWKRAGGSSRWVLSMASTAESGGNAGSGIGLNRYDDAGAVIGSVLTVSRADGIVNMPVGATTATPTVGDNSTRVATTAFVKTAVSGVPGGASPSDTPPATPGNGQLWFKSTTGVMYCWYNDGNTSQWVQVSASPQIIDQGYTRKTALGENRVVNGGFQHDQENSGVAVGASGYAADQWQIVTSGVTPQAIRGLSTTALTPDGNIFSYIHSFSVAKTTLAAADYSQVIHLIEGVTVNDFQWGTAAAKDVVLRFSAKTDMPGLYSVAIHNGNSQRCWLKGFNLTTAWQTFVFAVPGDTTGTWPNAAVVGMSIRFCTAVGSNWIGVEGWQTSAGGVMGLAGQVNVAAVANKGPSISDVGLYVDPDKTGLAPKWQTPDVTKELLRCQRYWRRVRLGSAGYGAGNFYANQQAPLSPQMRTSPSVALKDEAGNANAFTIAGANNYSIAGGGLTSTPDYIRVDVNLNGNIVNTWWSTNAALSSRM